MLEVLESGTIIVPVGSRVTCSPPPTDTDEDFLLLVEDLGEAVIKLKEIGFDTGMTKEQEDEYLSLQRTSGGRFRSLRFGDVNYIVTQSAFFFDRFMTATHICKTMNVMDKQQRILIFSGVFGDSHLDKTAGITDDILERVSDDIYSKTFEEGVESTPFEEHVAVKSSQRMGVKFSTQAAPEDNPFGSVQVKTEGEAFSFDTALPPKGIYSIKPSKVTIPKSTLRYLDRVFKP
jgi:hypothetical protein